MSLLLPHTALDAKCCVWNTCTHNDINSNMPHSNVWVNDGPYMQQWNHEIISLSGIIVVLVCTHKFYDVHAVTEAPNDVFLRKHLIINQYMILYIL